MRVERTIVIEGDDEWVYRTLGSALVGPDRPVYECPRGTITETSRSESRSSGTAIHPRVEIFAQDIANYVRTHARWAEMSKEAAAREAIQVALTDPSAAKELLDAMSAQNGSEGAAR